MMKLEEAMRFIHAVSWLRCRPGLERITDLMRRLGNPQDDLRFIHITGTNGKGSTAAMLSAILKEAGYTVGTFTSPHLRFYNERIKLNDVNISDDDLCAAAEKVKSAAEQMDTAPSEFERLTAMAFLYFHQKNCDIVVLEVGLGGLLDSTNVIASPEAAVITNVSFDHTEYLGNTLHSIAVNKAGIIKPGTSVVLYEQSKEVEAVVRAKCADCESPLRIIDASLLKQRAFNLSGQRFDYRNRKDVFLRLLGVYQIRNAAVALDTVDALLEKGWAISETAIRQGLASVVWPGRFELLQTDPVVLVDGAHNPDGVQALALCLRTYLPGRKFTFVMGVMADKDYDQMLDIIAPLAKEFITVTPDSHRSLTSETLQKDIEETLHLPALSTESVQNGIAMALRKSAADDAICVFGSLYQAGDVLEFFGK